MNIKITHLSKIYRSGANFIPALSDVSIEFPGGIMAAIVGPSGSGKSTLMNLIGALDKPSSGDIAFDDFHLNQAAPSELSLFRNRMIGFVFQNYNLIPVLSALENVELPGQLRFTPQSLSETKLRSKARELLASLGLAEQLNQRANTLSGGQMQRVAIARALINDPGVIVADEPTANLDRATSVVILDVLTSLARSRGITVIVATHDDLVMKFCDRVIKIRDGRLDP